MNWPLRLNGYGETHVDTGDGLVDAIGGHIESSCFAWQSIQDGIVISRKNGPAVAIASPDAPLYQPGGPHASDPHTRPKEAHGGVFWSINTHWDTNFPISVTDHVPFRLTLGLETGGLPKSRELLQKMVAIPIIVRTPFASPGVVAGFWPA